MINPDAAFPGKTAGISPQYPFGKARNVSAPGDGTGTPLDHLWLNDWFGFQQYMVGAYGITPSGIPDDATVSQLAQAIIAAILQDGTVGHNVIVVDRPPYLGDLKAAYDAVPVFGNTVLQLGKRTYNFLGKLTFASKNTKPNLSIIGVGRPRYDSLAERLEDGSGTVIQGSIFNSAKGLKVFSLGIDRGEWVRVNMAGGNYDDAFVNHTFGADAGIQYGDLTVLEARVAVGVPASNTHCILNENGSGVTQTGIVEVIDGYHGHVLKCQEFTGGITIAKYQAGTALIAKSDAGAKCARGKVLGVIIDGDGARESAGVLYEAQSQTLDDFYIGFVSGRDCRWLVDQAAASTASITDFRVGSVYGAVVSGNNARQALVVGSKTVGMLVGNHELNACVKGGVLTEAGATVPDIGHGFSKGATAVGASGYKFAGSCRHGQIAAEDNAGWGVENTGNKFINAENVFCAGNTLGGLSGVPVMTQTPQNSWADPDGTFRAIRYGSRVRISGRLVNGSTGAAGAYHGVMKLNGGGRPFFDEYLACTGQDGAGAIKPLIAKIDSNGVISVRGMQEQAITGVAICGEFVIQGNW